MKSVNPRTLFEAKDILRHLGECFNKTLKEDYLEAYAYKVLKKVSIKELKAGCERAVYTESYYPSIAKLVQLCPRGSVNKVPEGYECEKCQSTGIKLVDTEKGYARRAYRCSCLIGKSMSEEIQDYEVFVASAALPKRQQPDALGTLSPSAPEDKLQP